MIHYEFKTCISEGVELHGFMQEEPNGQRVMSTRNARFPESLLSFLDFDIEQIRLAFQPLADGVRKVIAEKSREESDRVCQMFAGLTNYHPYFVLLFLDWRYRLDRAWYLGYEFPQNYLQVEYLDEMPDNLERLQRQALDLLTHIWVEDTSEKSVDEKMTAYYLDAEQAGKDVFRFRPQKMSCELMFRETFAPVQKLRTAVRGDGLRRNGGKASAAAMRIGGIALNGVQSPALELFHQRLHLRQVNVHALLPALSAQLACTARRRRRRSPRWRQ